MDWVGVGGWEGEGSNVDVEMKKKKKTGQKIQGDIAVMDQRVLKTKKKKKKTAKWGS